MSSPLISVIVPVYNCEKYIDDCIQSIITQSYSPLEIILINDGSTDESALICDKYSSEYSYIETIHKLNGGVSTARNVGLENANGEYVMFVDGDDMLESNAIETLLTTLKSTKADIAEGLFLGY